MHFLLRNKHSFSNTDFCHFYPVFVDPNDYTIDPEDYHIVEYSPSN